MRTCPHCHGRLIEIDHYGERLIGCIECNRWGRSEDATPPLQLLEDDLEAITHQISFSPKRMSAAKTSHA